MISRPVVFERFEGRSEELAHLIALRAHSALRVEGALVSIAAEAGVGKSRLIREFEAAIRGERGMFLRTRCEELAIPFAPFAVGLDAARHRRDGRDVRSTEFLREAIQALTSTGETDESDPKIRFRTALDIVSRAFERLARLAGHLTFVVDDAHWCDLGSLAILATLGRRAATLPLMIVVTYRPEDLLLDHERACLIGEFEQIGVDRMSLQPLARGDIISLLRTIAPSVPEAKLRRISDLSEGRPFFAEELGREVLDTDDDRDGFPAIALSLKAAVLGRIGRLEPEHLSILERAAVLGRNFTHGDLNALGFDDRRLFGAFRAALDLQIVEERAIDGDVRFRFRHALTREILYRGLPSSERRNLHREISDRLALQPERLAEFAYHVAAAGDDIRSASVNEEAGDRARSLGAYGDAARNYRISLDLARDPQSRGRTGCKLVDCLNHSRNLVDLEIVARSLIDRLIEDDNVEAAMSAATTAYYALLETRRSAADEFLNRMKDLDGRSVSPPVRYEFEMSLAAQFRMADQHEKCLEACARARAAMPDLPAHWHNKLCQYEAHAHVSLGRLEEAIAAVGRLSTATATFRHTAIADLAFERGDMATVFDECLLASADSERRSLVAPALAHRWSAAYAGALIGRFEFVAAEASRARRDTLAPSVLLQLAELHLIRATGGEIDRVLPSFEERLTERVAAFTTLFATDLASLVDDRSKARTILSRALDSFTDGDNVHGTFVEAAALFCSDVELERAIERWDRSLPSCKELERLRMLLAESQIARRRNRPIESKASARAALEIATRLGCWLPLATAHELCGDLESSRATLARVGAVAEVARFDRRHAAPTVILRPKFTLRERQVAGAIVAGKSNREIARDLAVAVRTVDTHVANIYTKAGVKSRDQLAAWLAANVGA